MHIYKYASVINEEIDNYVKYGYDVTQILFSVNQHLDLIKFYMKTFRLRYNDFLSQVNGVKMMVPSQYERRLRP